MCKIENLYANNKASACIIEEQNEKNKRKLFQNVHSASLFLAYSSA